MTQDNAPSRITAISMKDMALLISREFKNPAKTIQRWIGEDVLLPKMSGTIRDALYPVENHARILLLKSSGLIQAGKKPNYRTLRLVLWLNGFPVPVQEDLASLTGEATQSLKKYGHLMMKPSLNDVSLDFSLVPNIHPQIASALKEEGLNLTHVPFESFVDNLGVVFPSPNPEEDKTDSRNLSPYPMQYGDVDIIQFVQNLFSLFFAHLKLSDDTSALVKGLNEQAVRESGRQIGVVLRLFNLPLTIYFETEAGKSLLSFAINLFFSSWVMVEKISHSPTLANATLSSIAGKSWSDDLMKTFFSQVASKNEESHLENRKDALNETLG
jgi:hypothetical protein